MLKTALDDKGRLVVPLEFRRILRMGDHADVFVQLDEENERLVISPATGKRMSLLLIELSDQPGSLAKAAKVLFEHGADLISTESRALQLGKTALWRVVADTGRIHDFRPLKSALLLAGARSVKISQI
jgi:bifunctional DNA-binding transcriptional regulator/antitoxin component of YhaV-PrlF toxin-antitoxin module